MKRRGFPLVVALLAVCLLASANAFAQGGGASTTGSINGKVVDSSGGVLPGVTVSATSPSAMGVQTSVTDTGGNYRFPALPPGTYTVTFELPGFNTLKRENIQIAMGFTAAVNVELAVASLQETVTVTGDSPVIDTSATRVQQNFKLEALQEIPNSRDLWSLLAVTPGVSMQRIDVGGNRAGTQTDLHGVRLLAARTACWSRASTRPRAPRAPASTSTTARSRKCSSAPSAQGAEMPTPGVQSQMLGKSGGNKFQGEIYQDYENNSLIAENIEGNLPEKFLFGPTNPSGIRLHSNETQKYRDFNVERRRPDQEGQGLVVLLVPQPEDLRRPAELHRRHLGHAVRHQAVEPLGQDDLSDEQEQQADWLLPVGPEGAAEPPAVGDQQLRQPRRDAVAALGQLDLQG